MQIWNRKGVDQLPAFLCRLKTNAFKSWAGCLILSTLTNKVNTRLLPSMYLKAVKTLTCDYTNPNPDIENPKGSSEQVYSSGRRPGTMELFWVIE